MQIFQYPSSICINLYFPAIITFRVGGNILDEVIRVPGNVSRLFESHEEAVAQKTGKIDLDFHPDGFIFNKLYNPEITIHDQNYCTSNPLHLESSTNVFLESLGDLLQQLGGLVVDIGCGQGEFVSNLRRLKINAIGYDPVLREISSFLYPKYFHADELGEFPNEPIIFTMRCVLPHIENPWEYLDSILSRTRHKETKYVYVEYQQTEWVVREGIWQQISHDHVNLFTLSDFQRKYKVLKTGEFSNGEWRWILLCESDISDLKMTNSPVRMVDLNGLMQKRLHDIEKLSSLEGPLAIYGASGKGAMIAHALVKNSSRNSDLVAVDNDPNRAELYLESSGVQVKPLEFLTSSIEKKRRVIVANPNHIDFLNQHLDNASFVSL